MSREFWSAIDSILDRIEAERPDTFDAVRDILDHPEQRAYAGVYTEDASFFGGSGGDRSLWSALSAAGWRSVWWEASYYYAATHPATGDVLTYIEGDVFRGNRLPLPHELPMP